MSRDLYCSFCGKRFQNSLSAMAITIPDSFGEEKYRLLFCNQEHYFAWRKQCISEIDLLSQNPWFAPVFYKPSFGGQRSFCCYYGESLYEPILDFGVAILEPSSFSKAEIERLNLDVATIGYCSIGQATQEEYEGLDDKSGVLGYDNSWQAWWMDPNNEEWREVVLAKAEAILRDQGFRGIFLDTVDVVGCEYSTSETISGMIGFIRSLRQSFKDKLFVQNRGFTIFDDVRDYLNGVMWEDFSTMYENGDYRIKTREEILETHGLYNDLRLFEFIQSGGIVFSLDYCDTNDLRNKAWSRARTYGFVHFNSTIDLDEISTYTPIYDGDFVSLYGKEALDSL